MKVASVWITVLCAGVYVATDTPAVASVVVITPLKLGATAAVTDAFVAIVLVSTAHVPVLVMVPPVKPVPQPTLVTVPIDVAKPAITLRAAPVPVRPVTLQRKERYAIGPYSP